MALLEQCIVIDPAKKGLSSARRQSQAWKDPKEKEPFPEPLSSWRLGNVQDALCELVKQQTGLQRSVQDLAEMQKELRLFLQESQSCLEQRLADIAPPSKTYVAKLSELTVEEVSPEALPPSKDAQPPPELPQAPDELPPPDKDNHAADPDKVKAYLNSVSHGNLATPRRGNFLKRVMSSPYFDLAMAFFIILNFGTIMLEVELKSWDLALHLGKLDSLGDWKSAKAGLDGMEGGFNVLFAAEFLLRLAVFGPRQVLGTPLDMLDGMVTTLCTGSFLLDTVSLEGFRYKGILAVLRVTRLLRALRLLRFVRELRLMTWLGPLRVLVHTIAMSMDSLVWALVVMGCIIVASGLLVANLVTDFLYDESKDMADREWVFMYFGSATRASYTMFEATFSGIWASRLSRRMIEEINPWWMLFWCCYTCTVNFAVIRVVSALFLKRTLDVAQNDAERIAMARLEEKEKTIATIREIFRVADQSGDGVLTRWEFDAMMENHEVQTLFLEVELEAPELHLLFNLLCQDDGVVDQEEFLAGAMKLKSDQVKLIDIIQVHHEATALRRHMEDLREGMERVDEALHPEQPWRASWSNGARHKHKQKARRRFV